MGLTRNGWTRKRGNDIKGYSHQFELKRVHLSDSYGRDASRRCAARSVSTWRDSLPAETPKQLQPAKTNGIEASTGETEKKTRIFINTPKNVRCACRRMTKEFTSKCDVENSHLLFLPPIRWRPYKVEKSLLKRCTGRLFFTWRVVFRLCVSVVISHFTLFFLVVPIRMRKTRSLDVSEKRHGAKEADADDNEMLPSRRRLVGCVIDYARHITKQPVISGRVECTFVSSTWKTWIIEWDHPQLGRRRTATKSFS